MAIRLIFFLLSYFWNIEYRIGNFKKLSNYWILDQGLDLSDYRISDSQKAIVCQALKFGKNENLACNSGTTILNIHFFIVCEMILSAILAAQD